MECILLAMASTLLAMASNLLAMASNLLVMASNLQDNCFFEGQRPGQAFHVFNKLGDTLCDHAHASLRSRRSTPLPPEA